MEEAISSMAVSKAILHDVVTKEKKKKLPHKRKLHMISSKVIIQKVSGNKVNLKIDIFLCINHEQSRREGRNNPICNSNS